MTDEPMYDEWLANLRDAQPSGEFTDNVMAALEERQAYRSHCVTVADGLSQSPVACLAACFAAMFIGSLPFLLVAHAAKLLTF